MSRTVYVNGSFLPEEDAKVSIFDRGFLFADSVYEVTAVLDSRLIDFDSHMRRLERSLAGLGMSMECDKEKLLELHRRLVSLNGLVEGLIYLQVTRGEADRDFHYPVGVPQTVVMFSQEKRFIGGAVKGLSVISVPDLRWHRRDIKTVQLLAASMAKMAAQEAGKDDAWLVEGVYVTEGTSSNAYIITRDGTIVTRSLSTSILPGTTRAAVLRLASEQNLTIAERAFTIEEAQDAAEAFITSATTFVTPVVEIDGIAVADGRPGRITGRLRELYIEESRKTAV